MVSVFSSNDDNLNRNDGIDHDNKYYRISIDTQMIYTNYRSICM